MSSVQVEDAYLVHTALDERGDMVVVNANGEELDYRVFKKRVEGLRLTFPSHDAARTTEGFQVWAFQRSGTNSCLLLYRSTISGTSCDNRPMPVFEVFRLRGAIGVKDALLDCVRSLSFPAYPLAICGESSGVQQPYHWFSLSDLEYAKVTNKKRKDWKKVSSVSSWRDECKRCVDKLLWFACNRPQSKDGISLCFTTEAFTQYDVCTCYVDRMRASFVKYNLLEFG